MVRFGNPEPTTPSGHSGRNVPVLTVLLCRSSCYFLFRESGKVQIKTVSPPLCHPTYVFLYDREVIEQHPGVRPTSHRLLDRFPGGYPLFFVLGGYTTLRIYTPNLGGYTTHRIYSNP